MGLTPFPSRQATIARSPLLPSAFYLLLSAFGFLLSAFCFLPSMFFRTTLLHFGTFESMGMPLAYRSDQWASMPIAISERLALDEAS